MSLASLAAAATVHDRIEDVARDVARDAGRDAGSGISLAVRRIRRNGIATVLADGTVHMNEGQSFAAADIIDRAERSGTW